MPLSGAEKLPPYCFCTKHGRGALARAKLLAGLFWIFAASVCMLAVYLAFQFSVLGTSGLACPVQLIKPLATAPLTIWQTELICMAGMLLSAVSVGSIVLWLSARLHSAFAAGVAMALGIFGLPLLAQNMPAGISQWLDLLPHDASGLYGELMRANLFHVFSLRIWSPWMFLFSQAVLAAVFPILCMRTWKRGR